MKKIISLCLALILIFSVFTVAVFAENESEKQYPGGSLPVDWNSIDCGELRVIVIDGVAYPYFVDSPSQLPDVVIRNSEDKDTVVVSVDPEAWGDLDGDRNVTSADARICLRASAKLESLPEEQHLAADIYGDGEISARNARKILRVAARLDIFDCYTLNVKLRQGESLRIEKLMEYGPYYWDYILQSNDAIAVRRESFSLYPTVDPNGEPIFGRTESISYTFTPKTTNGFSVKMVNKMPWEDNSKMDYAFSLNVDYIY